MANAFKNVTVTGSHAADTDIDVGSAVASGATHTLIGMTISNIISSVISVDVILENSSSRTYIVKAAPIPVGGSLITCGGDQKIVLWYHGGNGDQIVVRSNTLNSTNIVLSYLETT
tara:strand:+ start:326 stop:673 length:348 start_codon:yes stop_codon:yes gene_type:complete